MSENWKSKRIRLRCNFFPAYRRTGARVIYISSDLQEWRIKLPLNWKTRNLVGTIFGGSMYAAVDPIYMTMLILILGKEYIIWDKAATIRFKRPGKETLYASFILTNEELKGIRSGLAEGEKMDRVYHVELKNAKGEICALIEKTIYIRRNPSSQTTR